MWKDRSVIVPAEMAEESSLNPSHVQVRPEYGGGFPANVEGLHHLHCLVSRYKIPDSDLLMCLEPATASIAL